MPGAADGRVRAAVRVSTPSLLKTRSRCLLIARGLLPRMSPISLLVLPGLTQKTLGFALGDAEDGDRRFDGGSVVFRAQGDEPFLAAGLAVEGGEQAARVERTAQRAEQPDRAPSCQRRRIFTTRWRGSVVTATRCGRRLVRRRLDARTL